MSAPRTSPRSAGLPPPAFGRPIGPPGLHRERASELTVDAGIAADLGRDVVDSEALPEPAGRHGSERQRVVLDGSPATHAHLDSDGCSLGVRSA